jgi:hypothetical protein
MFEKISTTAPCVCPDLPVWVMNAQPRLPPLASFPPWRSHTTMQTCKLAYWISSVYIFQDETASIALAPTFGTLVRSAQIQPRHIESKCHVCHLPRSMVSWALWIYSKLIKIVAWLFNVQRDQHSTMLGQTLEVTQHFSRRYHCFVLHS